MTKLFVDDIREAPDDSWVTVRTAQEVVAFLFTHDVRIVSLDHDLGEGQSGYWVACQIEAKVHSDSTYIPPSIITHSANPVGRANITACMRSIQIALESRYED